MDTVNKSAYEVRPQYYSEITCNIWENWKWQQKYAVKDIETLKEIFPNFSSKQIKYTEEWLNRGYRFKLTPYLLSIVEKDTLGNPLLSDPLWRQFFPVFDFDNSNTNDEYSSENENWEIENEMITPIAQHKYDNRVIIYTADVCLGYCNYCLRSLQSNDEEEKHGGNVYWKETIEAISKIPQVEEVIISGGDPLVYDNKVLEGMLKDLRTIPSLKAIRIHSRAFVHNPYRIDLEYCQLLKQYNVTEMAVHISHKNEMTKEFLNVIDKIQINTKVLLLAQTPLIAGVNNSKEILYELFMELYSIGIKPYYLLHNMPNIPSATNQRTSVRDGVHLMRSLGRKISHPALPEYIIVHKTGKKTVPLELEGTSEFQYKQNDNGDSYIEFLNWKGNWVKYLDK